MKKFTISSDLYKLADSQKDKALMEQMKAQDLNPVPVNSAKPKFTLIVGPSPFTMMRGWEFFITAPFEGATYIVTVVHNAGYPVRIVDVRFSGDPLNEAYRQIMQGTDVLGICTFEDNFPFVKELIEKVKSSAPGMPVICGGSLVTSVPHVFMEHTKTDIAVISEGELTILELMESFTRNEWKKDLPRIHGIVYRDENGGFQKTSPRGQMTTLDFLPKMRLDLWPQYHDPRGMQRQIIASYSRGCRMDCSFCFRTTPRVACKSPEKFKEDLDWLKEQYNIDFIMFSDLTFTSIKQQTLDMCRIIKDYDLRWSCMTRCSDVDAERLKAMKDSGCDLILYGVESLDINALNKAHKQSTKNITLKAMELTYEHGIRFGTLLIVGIPGESAQTLDMTASWAEKMNHIVRVKYLSLLPGTAFYQEALQNGIIKSEVDHLNWLSIEQNLYHDEFINISGLPEEVIRKAHERIFHSYMPGPVMDFKHFPEHFDYYYPNPDDGSKSSVEYAGKGWRKAFSMAGPSRYPGSERFTFSALGRQDLAEKGAKLIKCQAKRIGKNT